LFTDLQTGKKPLCARWLRKLMRGEREFSAKGFFAAPTPVKLSGSHFSI
jgi:hypothetical protein